MALSTFLMSPKSLFLVSLALMLVYMGETCSPPEGGYQEPTLEYKMMNSDVVAYGKARDRTRDNRFPHSEVYTVDFELRCIFKGAPLDEMIKIHEVGSIPGMCLSTNMTVGSGYLVYLRRNSQNQLVPEYGTDPGDAQYFDEIVVVCEATVSYPNGYSADNNKESCPEEYNYDDCLPRPEITTLPPPPEMSTPPKPPMPPNDSNPLQAEPKDESQGQGKAAYNPVVSGDDDENSAVTLSLNLSALLCLLLSTLVL